MACQPFMCNAAADCADLNCPGHPDGAAAYLDKQDRQALAHDANTQAGSFVPRDAQITVENWPPLSRLTLARTERWARWGFAALVIGFAAWWLYANWPMLRWALQP